MHPEVIPDDILIDWMRTAEVAAYLGITDSGVQGIRITTRLFNGRNRLYSRAEVEAYKRNPPRRGRPAKKEK